MNESIGNSLLFFDRRVRMEDNSAAEMFPPEPVRKHQRRAKERLAEAFAVLFLLSV